MGLAMRGQANIPSLSLPSKVRLGFVPSTDVLSATLPSGSSATFTQVLRPISSTSGARGIQITDPISGGTYWVEYRSGTGQDANLAADSSGLSVCAVSCATGYQWSYGPGVRILKVDNSNPGSPETLAVTTAPALGNSNYRELSLGTLESFSNAAGTVHVDVNWVTPAAASVTVRLTSAPVLEPGLLSAALSGTTAVGQVLTVVRPNFRLLGATLNYRWMRDGSTISGATDSSYLLDPADQGTHVSVEVTASLTGFTDGVATTPGVLIGALGSTTTAFSQLKPLLIVPTPTNVAGSAVEPTLLYRVDFAQTGAQYSLQAQSPSPRTLGSFSLDSRGTIVTTLPWALGAGIQQIIFSPLTSGLPSDPVDVAVAQRTPTAKVALSTYSGRRTTIVKATVTLGNWSPLAPTGTIDIRSGSTVIATVPISDLQAGVVTVNLPKFSTIGSRKISAVYHGDTNYLPTTSLGRTLLIHV
jgi:hypothetical protein